MDELLQHALGLALGTRGGFHVEAWVAVTVALALVGIALATLGGTLGQPVAVIVARKPRRVVLWMVVVAIVVPLALLLLVVTIIGATLAVVALFALALVGVVGYLAAAMLVGDRLARAAGVLLTPWAAVLAGVLVFRLLRLVPFAGAPLHSAIVWFGLAAAGAALWDAALSWHQRRLPDEVQFDNSTLIEWDEYGPRRPDGP